MKKTRRFASLCAVMAVIMLMTSLLCVPASAATGKSKSYSVFTSKTISVTTNKSGAYMTFKSTGTGSYQYGAEAPILSLKVYNHKTGETRFYRVTGTRWTDSVSSKLKLNANTTYTVTVSYIYDKSINWGTYGSGMYRKTGWYDGTWRITATKNLTYSIK